MSEKPNRTSVFLNGPLPIIVWIVVAVVIYVASGNKAARPEVSPRDLIVGKWNVTVKCVVGENKWTSEFTADGMIYGWYGVSDSKGNQVGRYDVIGDNWKSFTIDVLVDNKRYVIDCTFDGNDIIKGKKRNDAEYTLVMEKKREPEAS